MEGAGSAVRENSGFSIKPLGSRLKFLVLTYIHREVKF